MRIPSPAQALLRALAARAEALGIPLYAVGGCVRDWVRGAPTRDFDLLTEADPEPLAQAAAELLSATARTYGRFGTWTVSGAVYRVDFARSRRERYPAPADLPVVDPAPLAEDLKRRDFTVNSIAVRLTPGFSGKAAADGLIDPFGGTADLKNKVLRALHPESFRDDPTRVFRAARYAVRLGLKPRADLVKAARAALAAGHAARLSRHRLAQELVLILSEKKPEAVLALLKSWGYARLLHPRFRWPRLPKGAWPVRLGAIVLAMGKEGVGLLDSLPIERSAAAAIREAAGLIGGQAAPRAEPSDEVRRIVLTRARLAPAALQPVFLGGPDLENSGIPRGPRWGEILDEAARAQWKVKFSTRAAALKWLAGRLKGEK